MNASEAAAVLTAAALVDKRTVGEADARMWAEILPGGIGPLVAVEAVKSYYRENRQMIMPADIIKYSNTARGELSKNRPLDYDTFRDLANTGARLIYSREFYEALARGASADQANAAAKSYTDSAPESERIAIAPARVARRPDWSIENEGN